MRKTNPSSVTTVVSMSSASAKFTDLFRGILWMLNEKKTFYMTNRCGELVPLTSAVAVMANEKVGRPSLDQPDKMLKFFGYLQQNKNNIKTTSFRDDGACIEFTLDQAFKSKPSCSQNEAVDILGFKFRIDPAAVGIKRQTEEPHDGGMAKKGRVDSEGFAIPAPAPAKTVTEPTKPVVQAPTPAKTVTAPAKTVAEPVKPVVQAASSPMAYHEYAGGALKIVSGTVVFEAKAYALTFACLTMECGDDITIPLDTPGLSEAIDTLGVVRHSRRTNKVYFVNAIPGLKILGKTGVQRLELYYNPVPVTA